MLTVAPHWGLLGRCSARMADYDSYERDYSEDDRQQIERDRDGETVYATEAEIGEVSVKNVPSTTEALRQARTDGGSKTHTAEPQPETDGQSAGTDREDQR